MLENINTDDKKYIYVANYPPYEKELYKMEMKSLFKNDIEEKYFFSDIWVNPSRSPFIKEALKVIYEGDSVEEICNKIKEENLSYDDFKVVYVKAEEKNTTYEERLSSLRAVGFVITGEPDIHNPRVRIGISKIEDRWYFGEYEKNDFEWHIHDKKPYSYSNSLGIKLARALVNIAGGNDVNIKMVDPCCGVGTVVIEGVLEEI
ncbi:MAG: RNA methyltransferase [Clostridium sp.]|nr:RNA methyltransferase [Clostridium sp.]